MRTLLIACLLSATVSGCAGLPRPYTHADHATQQWEAEQHYLQMRMRDQIMQHGAGGCAPDFVTGGCL